LLQALCSLSERWVQPWALRSVPGAWACTLTQVWHPSLRRRTHDGWEHGGWVRAVDRDNYSTAANIRKIFASLTIITWLSAGRAKVGGAKGRPGYIVLPRRRVVTLVVVPLDAATTVFCMLECSPVALSRSWQWHPEPAPRWEMCRFAHLVSFVPLLGHGLLRYHHCYFYRHGHK
jgi:hypothetical protein